MGVAAHQSPWVMSRQALGDHGGGEAIGQVIRIVVAGPGSLVGKYPVGNTARTTVTLTEVAEVPADLYSILTTRDARSTRRTSAFCPP